MTDTYIQPMPTSNLPNPETDPQFYDGVLPKRAFAWVIDAVFIAIISSFAVMIVGVGTLGLGFFFAPIVALLAAFAYRFLSIAAKSRTPGMALMGLEFRSLTGERFDRSEAFVHTALYMLIFVSIAGQLLTILCALFTARGQTIADIITGSTAINRPL